MGLFLRRSVKFGPVRFNLSKSGVGVSTGVKGLRVGVSGSGKSYVFGGRGGVYFRQNLGSTSKGKRKSTRQIEQEQISAKGAFYIAWAAVLIVSFFFPLLLIISIPWTIYIIVKIVRNVKASKFKKSASELLEHLLENNNYGKIDEIISQIPKVIKNETDRVEFVLGIYQRIAFSFLGDRELEEDEFSILEKMVSMVPSEILRDVNVTLLNGIILDSTEDNRISQEEEDLILKCADLFKLGDMKDEIHSMIDDYRQLEAIENSPLVELSPSLKISDKSPFYYENRCQYKKAKKEKGIQSIIDDYAGHILLSAQNLHMVKEEGHKAIKLSSIISADWADKNIEMVVANRKTPLYFEPINNFV